MLGALSRWLAAAMVLSLLLASSAAAREQRERRLRNAGGCVALRVFSPQQEERRRVRSFSASSILDLEIEVLLPKSLEGKHRVDIELYTPDEQLYQKLTVPFMPSAESREPRSASAARRRIRKRKLPDYPRPVEEVPARNEREGTRGYRSISALLPVAGSSIVTSSLYGRWTAVAYLDGSDEPCTPSRSFIIAE